MRVNFARNKNFRKKLARQCSFFLRYPVEFKRRNSLLRHFVAPIYFYRDCYISGSSLFFISACERSAGCSRGIKSERHEKGASWKTKDTRKSDTELLFFLPPQPSYLIYSCMIHIFRTKFHNDLYVRFNACTLIYCYR